ncbi:hypothetical protein [Kitasatospora sp. NPDC087314]|uniref:hypothetical protein n=1 Tax=Kitasatospora sp. NPDC087314 TaxID=3364068 RepID=UPI003805B3AB
MGGAEAVVAKALEAYGTDTPEGFRRAAELLNRHSVVVRRVPSRSTGGPSLP